MTMNTYGEFIAGRSAAMHGGRFPVYRNYNYGTNLSTGLTVFGVFDTQEEADLCALNANTAAAGMPMTVNHLKETKS